MRPTKKQLEARKKFAYIMKHGGFKKSKKQGSKQTRRKLSKSSLHNKRVIRKQIRVLRKDRSLGSTIKSSNGQTLNQKMITALEQALNNPKVKSITIQK